MAGFVDFVEPARKRSHRTAWLTKLVLALGDADRVTPTSLRLRPAITDNKVRGTCGRRAMHDYAQRLRAFFRFAKARGWCVPGIAKGIMVPRFMRGESVPDNEFFGRASKRSGLPTESRLATRGIRTL